MDDKRTFGTKKNTFYLDGVGRKDDWVCKDDTGKEWKVNWAFYAPTNKIDAATALSRVKAKEAIGGLYKDFLSGKYNSPDIQGSMLYHRKKDGKLRAELVSNIDPPFVKSLDDFEFPDETSTKELSGDLSDEALNISNGSGVKFATPGSGKTGYEDLRVKSYEQGPKVDITDCTGNDYSDVLRGKTDKQLTSKQIARKAKRQLKASEKAKKKADKAKVKVAKKAAKNK